MKRFGSFSVELAKFVERHNATLVVSYRTGDWWLAISWEGSGKALTAKADTYAKACRILYGKLPDDYFDEIVESIEVEV
jgi:hypothetical protein